MYVNIIIIFFCSQYQLLLLIYIKQELIRDTYYIPGQRSYNIAPYFNQCAH